MSKTILPPNLNLGLIFQRMWGAPLIILFIILGIAGFQAYVSFRIDVPARHIAVLTKKTGRDLINEEEIGDEKSKGLQKDVLPEGRYFRNPFNYSWRIYSMVEIPADKMGIRVRLDGKDLPYGHFMAAEDSDKGIVEEPLKPGRYPSNALVIDGITKKPIGEPRPREDYIEIIELWDPVIIPAGYKGVQTNLAAPLPLKPNSLLVESGKRGPQEKTLDAGTYYLNPYIYQINSIDLRSQRFNLTDDEEMGFPSKDGFWVSLEGIIEFRIKDAKAAEVYVKYNDLANDKENASDLTEEIKEKVIMPNARSFCRIEGANAGGRDFIGGETRTAFQEKFEQDLRATCDLQGIEIVQALITRIHPPEAIAEPVRAREIAVQEKSQYVQQKLQQDEEAKLATERALVTQKTALVDAEREVVQMTTKAKEEQEVALAAANRDKEVAMAQLEAAKDKAEATLAAKRAEAAVITYGNEADAAGWKKAVAALGNDGNAYARYVLYMKLAPGYRSIMTNTADSPLMRVFEQFDNPLMAPAVSSNTAAAAPNERKQILVPRATDPVPAPTPPPVPAPAPTPSPVPAPPAPAANVPQP